MLVVSELRWVFLSSACPLPMLKFFPFNIFQRILFISELLFIGKGQNAKPIVYFIDLFIYFGNYVANKQHPVRLSVSALVLLLPPHYLTSPYPFGLNFIRRYVSQLRSLFSDDFEYSIG
ncbi:hypothetical protein SAY87_000763 [Trapa incisa]|uniref:Uncharacterized protein n=1 Tax=Trapa incisa TaxID=236973 RepID=A0AAN7JGV9_9MYRT|nr:hypothetical protein SAY87_000763 [Trapa incisa]